MTVASFHASSMDSSGFRNALSEKMGIDLDIDIYGYLLFKARSTLYQDNSMEYRERERGRERM